MDRVTFAYDEVAAGRMTPEQAADYSVYGLKRTPEHRPDRLLILALILFACVALWASGCATAEKSYRIALAETTQAVNGAYRSLDVYRHNKIGEIAASDKPANERLADMLAFQAEYNTAMKALGAITDTLSVTNAGSVIYGCLARKDYSCALNEVLAVGITVSKTLATFGVHL